MPHITGAWCTRNQTLARAHKAVFRLDNYTHVGIVDWDRKLVIEAIVFKKVLETPLDEWFERYPLHRLEDKYCPYPETGLHFARLQVGKKYDHLNAVGIALPFRANWNDDSRWSCGELFEATVGHAGRWRFEQDTPFCIHPMDCLLVV